MHFRHFWTSKHTLSVADKHHFPCEYYSLMIKCTKSHHPNWCIKVGNTPPSLPCWWVILIFFVTRHGRVSHVQFKTFTFKNNFTTPFYGTFMMGFNCLKATEPPWRDSLLFTTQPLGLPGTHLVNLRSTKGWVELGQFQTQDPYITNTAP